MLDRELSVVVPVLNEAANLAVLVPRLRALGVGEIVVVDGGSQDDSALVARRNGATVVPAPRGRGVQLARGVDAARGRYLWFVHADCRPGDGAMAALRYVLKRGEPGAFRLRFAHAAPTFRLIEWGVRWRSRWLGLPYGDQGMFLPREVYERAGGFPDWPLMEDVALARRVRRLGYRWCVVPQCMWTDPRRYLKTGPWRRVCKNQFLLWRFLLLGTSPRQLFRAYRPHGES